MKLEIDMTTGDIITPKEVDFGFPTLFGDEEIPILAYNIETILAEKITAILDLHIYSTRPKDFYDMYLFARNFEGQIDKTTLKTAVNNTLTRKHKEGLLQRVVDIMEKVIASEDIKAHWRKYQQEYAYATEIEFEQVIVALGKIFSYLDIEIIPSV
jgi:predicted nucleotidyltransferase component of viral defense system